MISQSLHFLVVPEAEEPSNRLLVVHTLLRKILDPPVVPFHLKLLCCYTSTIRGKKITIRGICVFFFQQIYLNRFTAIASQ